MTNNEQPPAQDGSKPRKGESRQYGYFEYFLAGVLGTGGFFVGILATFKSDNELGTIAGFGVGLFFAVFIFTGRLPRFKIAGNEFDANDRVGLALDVAEDAFRKGFVAGAKTRAEIDAEMRKDQGGDDTGGIAVPDDGDQPPDTPPEVTEPEPEPEQEPEDQSDSDDAVVETEEEIASPPAALSPTSVELAYQATMNDAVRKALRSPAFDAEVLRRATQTNWDPELFRKAALSIDPEVFRKNLNTNVDPAVLRAAIRNLNTNWDPEQIRRAARAAARADRAREAREADETDQAEDEDRASVDLEQDDEPGTGGDR